MVDDDGDVVVDGSSWYQRINAHVAHLQGQLNRFEEQLKTAGSRKGERVLAPHEEKIVRKARTHLGAAREAVQSGRIKRFTGAAADRALANVHEAEVAILRIIPESEIEGKGVYVLSRARLHLDEGDMGLQQLEAAVLDPEGGRKKLDPRDRELVALMLHAAYQAEEAERARVRSFTQIVVTAAVILWVIAVCLGVWGAAAPDVSQLFCFRPEPGAPSGSNAGKDVCPLGYSVTPGGVLFLEFIGLAAAAVAGAVSLKRVRGTSGPYHVATGLIVLRLPIGALTAAAGILLMSGKFFPGLTRLDTPTQVVAWAFAFGILQESVTRAVDRQGQHLLDNVKVPGTEIENGSAQAAKRPHRGFGGGVGEVKGQPRKSRPRRPRRMGGRN
ncbi:hypothetical protein ACSR0Z_36390 [Streptomyces viridosporus]